MIDILLYWLGYVAICYLVTGVVLTIVDVIRFPEDYGVLVFILSPFVIPAAVLYVLVVDGEFNIIRKRRITWK